MNDVELILILKKRGIISDSDITSVEKSIHKTTEAHEVTEEQAISLVSKFYHMEEHRKYIGEKYNMQCAKDVYKDYKEVLKDNITCVDVYIAINCQYHDYICLFKAWFNDSIDTKIIESAITYWFMDDDCSYEYKVLKYLSK